MTTEETTESAATERIDPRGVRSDLTVDDAAIASLEVWTANGEIANVKTSHAYQRMGYARALYQRAQADFAGGIFHTVYTHRTPDGDAFAHAVGGDTIDSCGRPGRFGQVSPKRRNSAARTHSHPAVRETVGWLLRRCGTAGWPAAATRRGRGPGECSCRGGTGRRG